MELKKVRVKCASAIEVTFRKKGLLYNNGLALIDMDTYNFVGKLGNDYIYGKFHEIGFYEIMYVNLEFIREEEGYRIGDIKAFRYEFDIPFVRDYYMEDFDRKLFKIGDDFEFSFERFILDNNQISSCIEENKELII